MAFARLAEEQGDDDGVARAGELTGGAERFGREAGQLVEQDDGRALAADCVELVLHLLGVRETQRREALEIAAARTRAARDAVGQLQRQADRCTRQAADGITAGDNHANTCRSASSAGNSLGSFFATFLRQSLSNFCTPVRCLTSRVRLYAKGQSFAPRTCASSSPR